MSETILVIVTVGESGSASKQDMECVGLGKSLSEATGGGFLIGVIGGDTDAVIAELKDIGANKVYSVSGEAYSASRYKTDAFAAQSIASEAGATIVLGAAGIRCRARVARR